jgi:hypothetical protein
MSVNIDFLRIREKLFTESFRKYSSDKAVHGYGAVYGAIPPDEIESIFELGVYWGGSILTYLDMFSHLHRITGMDINLRLLMDKESSWGKSPQDSRVTLIERDLRTEFANDLPDFDMVIDDGTHEIAHILHVWDQMYRKAKKYYIIEDIYFSRLDIIWRRIIRDRPQAQISFHRTSDHCGDERIKPDSDSHILVVKMERSEQ